MTSIELSKAQQGSLTELQLLMIKIEKETATAINHTDGEEVAYRLTRRVELQQHLPRIIELATVIYEHCKGLAAEEAMNSESILNLKADVQRKWFDGRLAKWSALYAKAEMQCKQLDRGVDGLRSILSREKELMKQQAT